MGSNLWLWHCAHCTVRLTNVFIVFAVMSSRSKWRAVLPSIFSSGTSPWPVKVPRPAAMEPTEERPAIRFRRGHQSLLVQLRQQKGVDRMRRFGAGLAYYGDGGPSQRLERPPILRLHGLSIVGRELRPLVDPSAEQANLRR